jgi:hypothetical protein
MKKLNKLLNILSVVIVILLVIGFIWLFFEIKEMLIDYRCSQLPINEFFKDNECKRYWRYRINE